MNLELFHEWTRRVPPSQNLNEWKIFLEICELYLKKREIKNPIVVELGVERNRQKKFYEQFLGAQHIGVDISAKRGAPDIIGNVHDLKTLEALKTKLDGNPINILFIDANHCYESVKKDFDMYSPLCSNIVALHDIDSYRYQENERIEVWRFWDELKEKAYKRIEGYDKFLFFSIYHHGSRGNLGIGVIIKK